MDSAPEGAPRRWRPRHSDPPSEVPPRTEELGLLERSHFTGHQNLTLEALRANRSHAANEALARAERELKAGNIERAQRYVELATALLDDR